ncbi:MAG: RNA polymerase sigma factor [Myxococcota bacterium]
MPTVYPICPELPRDRIGKVAVPITVWAQGRLWSELKVSGRGAIAGRAVCARSADSEAFEVLVEQTRDKARAVAYAELGDLMGVEDVVQDAYLQAFRSLDGLSDPAKFEAWLKQIVRNLARDRRRTPPWAALRFEPEVPMPKADPRLGALHCAVVQLSTQDRRSFERFYVGSWSTSRIAMEAGLRDAVVRKRLERIRRRLRKVMEMEENVSLPERIELQRLEQLMGVTSEWTHPYPVLAALDLGTPHEVLRADRTGSLLLDLQNRVGWNRVLAGGRVYGPHEDDADHLEAFH